MTRPKAKTELQIVRRVSQATATAVLGFKSTGSLRALADAPRNKDRSYDLTALVPWFIARQAQGQDDPMAFAAADGSPELEKWRRVRRQREEVELAARLRELASVSEVRMAMEEVAGASRQFAEQVIKLHGQVPSELWNEAIAEIERSISRRLRLDARRRELVVYVGDEETPVSIDLSLLSLEHLA